MANRAVAFAGTKIIVKKCKKGGEIENWVSSIIRPLTVLFRLERNHLKIACEIEKVKQSLKSYDLQR